MSLHIPLNPEAHQVLRRQRRNSTILAIVTATLCMVLSGLILGLVLLETSTLERPEILIATREVRHPATDDPQNPQLQIPRPRHPQSQVDVKVIAAALSSPSTIPVPEGELTPISNHIGVMDDVGIGSSIEAEMSSSFHGIPNTMRKRCSPADRLARLRETGGRPECEQAVEKALRWFKSTQNPDGSWDQQNKVGMTGLGLLAFLGRCETPMSNDYGTTVLNAIIYLVDVGNQNDGRLTSSGNLSGVPPVYEHGIATYALAEAYTFCNQLGINVPGLGDTVRKAGDIIVKGQMKDGAWVYGYAQQGEGDNSVGFWQIQALKACSYTGLWKLNELDSVGKKAVAWIKSVQGENGAVGYRRSPSQSPGLTGGGVLCIQLWEGSNSSAARRGIDFIMKNNPSFDWPEKSSNLYYNYYNTQALINHGGLPWQQFNERFRDELIKNQNPDGSWERARDNHDVVSTHMATSLATMMLEVYYRFLPGTGAAR